jgi:hypothetical protein
MPTCFAGEQVTVFEDGSYGCAPNLTAQSFGNPAPNCGGGTAYIDPSTSDWACTTPPQQQSSAGLTIFAVILAAAAFWYFGTTYGKKVSKLSTGDFSDFVPRRSS